jgi:tripartite-type tricarboxylate transporter receptor subunit TctC
VKNGKGWVIFLGIGMLTILVGEASVASAASDFPSRPIEMVIPYPPGGAVEIVVRPFKDKVSQILGQPVIFSFKPGAGGAAGAAYVAHAKPDGYTLLVGSTTPLIMIPLTKKDIGYSLTDFAAVCNLTMTSLVWLVKEDSSYKTMEEFIRIARTKKMKYSTYGTHGLSHICMEALGKAAGFQSILIPYPGGNPALAAVLGGHVDIGITPGSLGMAGPGKLRIIASAQEKRLELYPDVPTLGELGYPINGSNYFGLFAPKGTPKDILQKLCLAHKKVLDENGKEITDFFKGFENIPVFLDSEKTNELFTSDYALRKKMIEETGILLK